MEKNSECPLCLEKLEMDDVNFFPCKCGYQICRFCWHRIRTNENGLCPACRRHYPEDPANFKPLTSQELQHLKSMKKLKDIKKKQKIYENRKQLANVRVIQKNLVFVVGLPQKLVDADESHKLSYFKSFGKIQKLIINSNTSYAGSQGPSSCAYATYYKCEDALKAVKAINNTKVEGRTVKASLGTTKYCSNFLKKLHCPKQDCMYLHELADEGACFTKDEIQLGKHLEYEQKLHEQLKNSLSLTRKSSSNGELAESGTKDKQQKENEASSSASQGSPGNSQPMHDTIKDTYSSESEQNIHLIQSTNDFPMHLLEDISKKHSEPETNQQHENIGNKFRSSIDVFRNTIYDNDYFKALSSNTSAVKNILSDGYQESSHRLSPCSELLNGFNPNFSDMKSKSVLMEEANHTLSPKLHSPHLNHEGRWTNHSLLQEKKHHNMPWVNDIEAKVFESIPNGIGLPVPQQNRSLFFNSFTSAPEHKSDSLSTMIKNFEMYSNPKNGDSDNTFQEVQDDDLGFDPFQESMKGLNDLINQEAEEAAKTKCFPMNGACPNMQMRTIMDHNKKFNPLQNGYHAPLRLMNPPPGFAGGSFPSGSLANAHTMPNKMLPFMGLQNEVKTRPQFPLQRFIQNGAFNSVYENGITTPHVRHNAALSMLQNGGHQQSVNCYPQPAFQNSDQISPLSWNGVNHMNPPVGTKALENSPFKQNFIDNRSTSPLMHLKSQQHKFNEFSMRQLQQNGMKYNFSQFTGDST